MKTIFVLLLLLKLGNCSDDPCIESPSSCGNLQSITYPFRLRTDPITCGNIAFEITCQNSVPLLPYHSQYYIVKAINYHNYTIRLSPSNGTFFCNPSSPDPYYDLTNSELYGIFFPGFTFKKLYSTLLLFSCPTPLTNSHFPPYNGRRLCANNASHVDNPYWYACLTSLYSDMLDDSCRVELSLPSSSPRLRKKLKSLTLEDLYEAVDYGIQLSWLSGCIESDSLYQNRCFYIENITTAEYRYWSSILIVRTNLLYAIWEFLAKTPIGLLFKKIQWTPVLHFTMQNYDFYMAILKYMLVLLALREAPLLCFILPIFAIVVITKWRRRHRSIYDDVEEFLQSFGDLSPVRYSYSDVKKITNNFKEKIGEGGYGSVYKGKLRSGRFVAVKILNTVKLHDDGQAFVNEVATIGRVHHANIVRLLGFCAEPRRRALIYEFMQNGSLEKFIKQENSTDESHRISDGKMFDIAVGVARGIEYLHKGCSMQILHFDIKPHNVLLDGNLNPKISDFGLAKQYAADRSRVSVTAARGTLGYMAPEFFYDNVGGISHKADVYSYGRMLMEMAARRRDSSGDSESSRLFLPAWVHDQMSEGREIDYGVEEVDKEVRKKMMVVGLWCVSLSPRDRPSMRQVIEMLNGDVGRLALPPKPSYAPERLVLWEDSSSTMTETNSRNPLFKTD